MAINRPPFLVGAAGLASAGPITVAGTQVGDLVSAVQTTGANPAAGSFEAVVSVAGQIQQAATGLNANTYIFLIIPQGWKSIQN
jgi:hypothetical protein